MKCWLVLSVLLVILVFELCWAAAPNVGTGRKPDQRKHQQSPSPAVPPRTTANGMAPSAKKPLAKLPSLNQGATGSASAYDQEFPPLRKLPTELSKKLKNGTTLTSNELKKINDEHAMGLVELKKHKNDIKKGQIGHRSRITMNEDRINEIYENQKTLGQHMATKQQHHENVMSANQKMTAEVRKQLKTVQQKQRGNGAKLRGHEETHAKDEVEVNAELAKQNGINHGHTVRIGDFEVGLGNHAVNRKAQTEHIGEVKDSVGRTKTKVDANEMKVLEHDGRVKQTVDNVGDLKRQEETNGVDIGNRRKSQGRLEEEMEEHRKRYGFQFGTVDDAIKERRGKVDEQKGHIDTHKKGVEDFGVTLKKSGDDRMQMHDMAQKELNKNTKSLADNETGLKANTRAQHKFEEELVKTGANAEKLRGEMVAEQQKIGNKFDKQHGVIKQNREKIDALDKTATEHGKRLTNVEESAGRLLNDLGESNLQIGGNEKNLRGHSNELAEMGKTFGQIQGRLDGHRQHFTALGQANDDRVAGIAGLRTNFNTKIDNVRLHLRRTNGNVSDHTRMNAEHRGILAERKGKVEEVRRRTTQQGLDIVRHSTHLTEQQGRLNNIQNRFNQQSANAVAIVRGEERIDNHLAKGQNMLAKKVAESERIMAEATEQALEEIQAAVRDMKAELKEVEVVEQEQDKLISTHIAQEKQQPITTITNLLLEPLAEGEEEGEGADGE